MIIYKITNKINGKIYIGLTTNSLRQRWNEPCNSNDNSQIICRAIQKYSRNNFKIKIIEECNTQKQLNKREQYWIKKLDSQNKQIGYNIQNGGNGIGKVSAISKEKMSKAQIKRYKTHSGPMKGKNIL